jgi:hypothetical protein
MVLTGRNLETRFDFTRKAITSSIEAYIAVTITSSLPSLAQQYYWAQLNFTFTLCIHSSFVKSPVGKYRLFNFSYPIRTFSILNSILENDLLPLLQARMARDRSIPGITVTIHSNGAALAEYPPIEDAVVDENDPIVIHAAARTTVNYIESLTDANFTIKMEVNAPFKIERRAFDKLAFDVWVDGKLVGTVHCPGPDYRKYGEWEYNLHGEERKETKLKHCVKKFKFSHIERSEYLLSPLISIWAMRADRMAVVLTGLSNIICDKEANREGDGKDEGCW